MIMLRTNSHGHSFNPCSLVHKFRSCIYATLAVCLRQVISPHWNLQRSPNIAEISYPGCRKYGDYRVNRDSSRTRAVMIRGLINVLQQTDNDCSHSNVSTFHTQFGAQTCFAKFTSELQTLRGGFARADTFVPAGVNKSKDGREALADEMSQNVQQSYLHPGWLAEADAGSRC